MNLSECNLGQIVKMKPGFELAERANIGHITGLTANSFGEIIPFILFACERQSVGIHHGLLDKLTD